MIALLLLLTACGATARPNGSVTDRGEARVWEHALLPGQSDAPVRIDRYDATPQPHVALLLDGRVYASNGPDVAPAVGAPLAGLALSARSRRVALLGIGSGIELGVLLASGAEHVDLYERRADLLAAAEGLADISGLTFDAGRPTHARLRVLESAEPATTPRYDLIVHAVGATVVSEPRRLYVTERLAVLRDLLAPGGVVVLHAQLFEIHEATLRTLLRTFAAVFPHVAVLTPEDYSADALLVGSRDPIALSWPHATELLARPALRPFVERSGYRRVASLALSVLLASEAEARAYAGRGRVLTSRRPLGRDELPRRPRVPAWGAFDQARWEQEVAEWARDQGFDEGLSASFYDPDWTSGRPCVETRCTFLRDAPSGDAAGAWMLDLAFAAMEHGRLLWAADLLDSARATGAPSDSVDEANAVLLLLGERAWVIPDPVDTTLAALELTLARTVEEAIRVGGAGDWTRAAAKIEEAARLATDRHTTSALELIAAAAWLRALRPAEVTRVIDVLLRDDADFVAEHPEVHYLLGRALVALADNTRAVLSMRRFAQLRARASVPIDGHPRGPADESAQ